MKREEKHILSRQRILDAAMEEFSKKGFERASLNTICSEKGISKGIIYHYFQDKDELYLLCVKECFDVMTTYMREEAEKLNGSAEERLRGYFDARLCFFAGHPQYLGIFADAVWNPPSYLAEKMAECRRNFDDLNIAVLTEVLESEPVREGLSVHSIVEDFRIYMDYFNMRFRAEAGGDSSVDDILREHEERCHRQLDILLYGVLGEKNEE